MIKNKIIENLARYKKTSLWGVFFNDNLIDFHNVRLFKSRGTAIKAITEACGGYYDRQNYNNAVEELIQSGEIEIRTI
jgi:hypothetical protein